MKRPTEPQNIFGSPSRPPNAGKEIVDRAVGGSLAELKIGGAVRPEDERKLFAFSLPAADDRVVR